MMIAMGFASQYLKDLLKYGKSTPYLEGMEYFRRGFGASGLLGTGERVVDFVFPIYQERYSNPVSWAFGTISGESAALSKVIRAGELGTGVATGRKSPEDLWKISPGSQAIRNVVEDVGTAWGFGGN